MKSNLQLIGISSLESITKDTRPISRPVHGWLKAIRKALGLPAAAVADRLNVSVSTVQAYEKREKAETITLETLRRAAGALDCDLIVAMVPRNGKTFADLAAQNNPEIAHLKATEHSMALEDQASNDLDNQTATRLVP